MYWKLRHHFPVKPMAVSAKKVAMLRWWLCAYYWCYKSFLYIKTSGMACSSKKLIQAFHLKPILSALEHLNWFFLSPCGRFGNLPPHEGKPHYVLLEEGALIYLSLKKLQLAILVSSNFTWYFHTSFNIESRENSLSHRKLQKFVGQKLYRNFQQNISIALRIWLS